jgi:hypothetical protein
MCLTRWNFLPIRFPHKSQKYVSSKGQDAALGFLPLRLFSVVSGNLTSVAIGEVYSSFAFCLCNSSSPGERE